MAIFHATVKVFSRANGHTATGAAAYRAGLRISDERTGTTHDYTRRKGVVSVLTLSPDDAPEWAADPSAVWNAAEKAENRRNSCVARELEVALPSELNPDQREALARDLGLMLVERYNVAVLVAVHEPSEAGDDRNHHAHIFFRPECSDSMASVKKRRSWTTARPARTRCATCGPKWRG